MGTFSVLLLVMLRNCSCCTDLQLGNVRLAAITCRCHCDHSALVCNQRVPGKRLSAASKRINTCLEKNQHALEGICTCSESNTKHLKQFPHRKADFFSTETGRERQRPLFNLTVSFTHWAFSDINIRSPFSNCKQIIT